MIIARYKDSPVEVLDVYTDGAEVWWAAIRALEGSPFIGGDRWPIRTAYTTAKVEDLYFDDCTCILPEHSCGACRATARRVYSQDEEIPYR